MFPERRYSLDVLAVIDVVLAQAPWIACMWRKLWKKFFAFELKTPSRFYFCSSCSCVLFFLFHFTQSTKMILKFRESTISRLERLRQREKEGSDTQEDGREREIVSEKNELLSHSYLLLTFFSQMQGTKLRLIQSPMRLKLSCWRPRFKRWSPSWRPELFGFLISYLDVFCN